MSTKINAVVDQDGLPVKLLLTPGQASDKTTAPALLAGLPPAKALVADRGYDSRAILQLVADAGGEAHIPTQKRVRLQRTVAPQLYRQRSLIERFFCRLKQFRRIATRFDKLARNFLAAVALASTRIWLQSCASPRPGATGTSSATTARTARSAAHPAIDLNTASALITFDTDSVAEWSVRKYSDTQEAKTARTFISWKSDAQKHQRRQ